MSLRTIGVVYRKEMLDSLRDRRTLISMIVVPVLVMPLLMVGLFTFMAKQVSKAREELARVMIVGGADSPNVRAALSELPAVEIVPTSPDFKQLISDKKIRAAVEIPEGFEEALGAGRDSAVRIFLYEGEIKSEFAARRVEGYFNSLREVTVRKRLAERQIPESILKPFSVERQNAAPPERSAAQFAGAFLPYLVILLCMTGAMYPAMDLTAGEKERGTIETILSSPVPRTHLVLGKFFTVLSASLATALLAIVSMAVSFRYAKNLVPTGVEARQMPMLQMNIDPTAVAAVFLVMLPVAVLFSGALLAIALFAKSFKEAQSYISPLMIVVILPAVAGMMPGIELNERLALVPILNASLVSKEIITGMYQWKYIGMMFASSSLYAALALAAAVILFRREDVLFRA